MRKKWIVLAMAIAFAFIGVGFVEWRQDNMVQELANEVLRFHVLANSDAEEDQLLKLQVKEAVLDYMQGAISENDNVEETTRWSEEHLDELEQVARK